MQYCLTNRENRRANIIAAIITIAYVIGGGSTAYHYLFLAIIGVICMSLIVWFAWQWTNPEVPP